MPGRQSVVMPEQRALMRWAEGPDLSPTRGSLCPFASCDSFPQEVAFSSLPCLWGPGPCWWLPCPRSFLLLLLF